MEWSKTENVRTLFNDRLKGEAYALRAVQMYYLLQAHGGWVDGKLLGVPIVTTSGKFIPTSMCRETHSRNVWTAYSRILTGFRNCCRLDFEDVADGSVPAKYSAMGINASDYNRVNGKIARGRITRRIVEAVQPRWFARSQSRL